MTKAKGAGRDKFHVVVQLAGRTGTQEEYETNKREAIRKCRNLTKQGDVGSFGSVTMTEEGGKSTLVFQCHMAKPKRERDAAPYLKIDEL